tara:strand:+ start:82918 stop:83889 length:972 start_codon:yes stop_codon:yes gene_type:complete
MKESILITGGAGFIGANFVNRLVDHYSVLERYKIVVLDALTYAGNKSFIDQSIVKGVEFVHGDICDTDLVTNLFKKYAFCGVIHFAAESHVDRSIEGPGVFLDTNVNGTMNLLEASLAEWKKTENFRYLQVSTDEVYGSLKLDEPAFTESHMIKPNSPYSASKASADLFVRSYFKTYGLPTLITRCSNNYGPLQNNEKLIPLMISNARADKSLPVYGTGTNVRDWIFVDDHNDGVWAVFEKGRAGEVYNLGGNAEKSNIDVVKIILKLLDKPESLISYVTDRLGHDFRYAMNFEKATKELGWTPKVNFDEGIKKTVEWYLSQN